MFWGRMFQFFLCSLGKVSFTLSPGLGTGVDDQLTSLLSVVLCSELICMWLLCSCRFTSSIWFGSPILWLLILSLSWRFTLAFLSLWWTITDSWVFYWDWFLFCKNSNWEFSFELSFYLWLPVLNFSFSLKDLDIYDLSSLYFHGYSLLSKIQIKFKM